MALLTLAACSFSKEIPGEEQMMLDAGLATDPGTNPTPTPARCIAQNPAVCIEFETMPPQDAKGSTLSHKLVQHTDRLNEKAAGFNAVTELRINDSPALDVSPSMTIEMWMNPGSIPSNSGDRQVGLFDTHLQYSMSYEYDARIECRLPAPDKSVDSEALVGLTKWTHVACTYDAASSRLKVYVDGELAGCEEVSNGLTAVGTLGAAIGANMDANGAVPIYKNYFIGRLDNVHLYARALSSDDLCMIAKGRTDCKDTCPMTGGSGGDND